jgi:hypothetical protein
MRTVKLVDDRGAEKTVELVVTASEARVVWPGGCDTYDIGMPEGRVLTQVFTLHGMFHASLEDGRLYGVHWRIPAETLDRVTSLPTNSSVRITHEFSDEAQWLTLVDVEPSVGRCTLLASQPVRWLRHVVTRWRLCDSDRRRLEGYSFVREQAALARSA